MSDKLLAEVLLYDVEEGITKFRLDFFRFGYA